MLERIGKVNADIYRFHGTYNIWKFKEKKNIWVVRERTLKKNKFLRQKSQMKQKFPSPEQRYETK